MNRHIRWIAAGAAALIALVPVAAAADEPAGRGGAAGSVLSAKGTVICREAPGKPWQLLGEKDKVPAGALLVGLPSARVASADGAVELTFLTDFSGESPFPVIEAAVRLNANPDVDLDVTLDRGRIDLTNSKDQGSARVRVHVRDAVWDLTLQGKGAQIAFELYSHWAPGVPFTPEPSPKDVPTALLAILVLHGEVAVKHGGFEWAMREPPGPALIQWDSVSGGDEAPSRLEKLPPWAESPKEDTPEIKRRKAILEQFRQLVLSKGLDQAIDELLASDDPLQRRLAVLAMAALDDIKRLGATLKETKHHDVWDNGVLAIRHWIGRGPGQDQILYKALLDGGFSDVHAETTMQLLHSFGQDDLARPETYQTLIAFLNHDRLAIRGLAYWHLSRLAPAGKKFDYHPWDDKEDRAAAVAKWKKLIPPGKVPPKPKAEDKK